MGRFFRSILNINTIWGLMILTAFALCVVQHYLPTTSAIPATVLREGQNLLTIRIDTSAEQTQSFQYVLESGSSGLVLPGELRIERPHLPFVLSADRSDAGTLLRWSRAGDGKYELLVNGKSIGSGSLPGKGSVITTLIAPKFLQEGSNVLTFRIKSTVQIFNYPLVLAAGRLEVPAEARTRGGDQPWILSAEPAGAGHILKWDHAGQGKYRVSVNGQDFGSGQLVRLQSLTDAAFSYATSGFNIALGLVAAMVLFLGLMKVGEDAGIVQLVARLFHPLLRFLFPGLPKDHPASGAVLMNITTSILGLGNAATPFGLKAMKELHSLNPHPNIATDAQVTLIAYNTAGFALLPTMLLAVRKSAGCSDPFEVIGTCMVTGATSTIVALTFARLLAKLRVFSIGAALAEEAREGSGAAMATSAAAADSDDDSTGKEA